MPVAAISVNWTKTAPVFSHPKKVIIEKMGRRAFEMIRKRIQDTGMTGDGQKVPPYRDSWFIITTKDPRFDGGQPSSLVMTDKGLSNTKRGGTTRVYTGGYAEAKADLGSTGMIGTLTGDMWRSGHIVVTRLGKNKPGMVVRVGFRGSSITSVYKARATNKKGKSRIKTFKKRIKNITKANQFERRDKEGKRTKTAQFQMMSLTRIEGGRLAADYLKGIKLLGNTVSSRPARTRKAGFKRR